MAVVALSTRTFRVSPRGGLPNIVRMAPGETDVLALDFTDCVAAGVTLSAVPSWTASSALVTLGGTGLTDGLVAGVVVTAGSAEGEVLLTCRATVATNAREYYRTLTVHVRTAT